MKKIKFCTFLVAMVAAISFFCSATKPSTPLKKMSGIYSGVVVVNANGNDVYNGKSKVNVEYISADDAKVSLSGVKYAGVDINQSVKVKVKANGTKNELNGNITIDVQGFTVPAVLAGFEEKGKIDFTISVVMPMIMVKGNFKGQKES